jgi:RNase P subunit RPR2
MASRPSSRPPPAVRRLVACPECDAPLKQVAPPAVRLVSSLEWSYPSPSTRQTCTACGWTSEAAQ